ncbi:MAG TPA: hypothetical protein VJH55_01755 [Candidatus Paceibacterota bacterium]
MNTKRGNFISASEERVGNSDFTQRPSEDETKGLIPFMRVDEGEIEEEEVVTPDTIDESLDDDETEMFEAEGWN